MSTASDNCESTNVRTSRPLGQPESDEIEDDDIKNTDIDQGSFNRIDENLAGLYIEQYSLESEQDETAAAIEQSNAIDNPNNIDIQADLDNIVIITSWSQDHQNANSEDNVTPAAYESYVINWLSFWDMKTSRTTTPKHAVIEMWL